MRRIPVTSWLLLIGLPPLAAAGAMAARCPPWAVMWAIAVTIFIGCKWLSWIERRVPAAPVWRHAAYLLAWPGLDADAFLDGRRKAAKPELAAWLAGAYKLAIGAILLFGIARHISPIYCRGWVGMVGLVLCLHFGSFQLLSCAWRTIGVEARPLMNRPLASVRLADFWGMRWNTAFRDITHRFLFRPLTRRLGGRGALWVGFLASGVVHDAVISVPAGGGYGGPTVFFLLQAAGMTVERSRAGRALHLGTGVRGWLFTMAVLLLPVRLLFHEPFVTRVVVPFMHAIGAVP